MEGTEQRIPDTHRDIGGIALPDEENLTVAVHQEDGQPPQVWLCYSDGRRTEVVRLQPEAARELGSDLCDAAHLLDGWR